MDISKEYQEMCKDLPDELKHEHPEPNDVVVLEDGSIGYIGNWIYDGNKDGDVVDGGCGCCAGFGRPFIWLPRQDQLQDMLDLTCAMFPLQECNRLFTNWCIENKYSSGEYIFKPLYLFQSMEQLWLAFIMSKTFGKEWNGNEWV